MTSKEAIETAKCMKESLKTGDIVEPEVQSITLECKPYTSNALTFKQQDPKDMKVVVWGKELTSVAEWEDFLKIGEELEQENKQLKEQLAEKDKEINKLQQMAVIDMQAKEILELQVITIRKQVCDEIREKLKAHCDYTDQDNVGWYLTEHKIDLLIDQIEKEKESMK